MSCARMVTTVWMKAIGMMKRCTTRMTFCAPMPMGCVRLKRLLIRLSPGRITLGQETWTPERKKKYQANHIQNPYWMKQAIMSLAHTRTAVSASGACTALLP